MPANVTTRSNFKVKLVSGRIISVLTRAEKDWFESSRDLYLAQTRFTENTDKMDLDRLLSLELMVFRWTNHLAAGVDYEDQAIDEGSLQRDLKLYSDQITKVKESMGLTKKARDDKAKQGNFADYLTELKSRAKEFGLHREEQLDKALELFNELSAVVSAFDRADGEEREKMGFKDEAAVLQWIRETAIPEYQAIDAYFRQNQQRYWVRTL